MIEFTKTKAKLTFNGSVYFPEVLETAVKDFKKSCKIKLVKEGMFSSVIIESKEKEDLKNLTYEFCNYSLALMKNRFVELARYKKNV